MEEAPSIETIFAALHALYKNPDTTGKERASVWLGELQKSVFAWQLSDQLLQMNQDVESCYFAAQTMRTKIQYAFHELPESSHQSLRDSLLNHVSKVTEQTPAVIATQLCLALADLSLQMATWKNAFNELIQRFGENMQHWHFLVELLTVLPEEVNSRSLRLGENRRTEIVDELIQTSPVIIQLLTAVIERADKDTRLKAKVLRCLASCFNLGVIPEQNIVGTPLMLAPFHMLMDKDCPSHLHEAASDLICAAFYAVEDLQKNVALAQQLFTGVMALPDSYHMSVASEDVDKSINYCRVFTDMADAFLEVIVATPSVDFGDLRTLELLLMCVDNHQYEVADITFNFWYRLSEALYQKNSSQLNELFKPFIQCLIVSLCRHCQFDPDHEGIPDNTDEFMDFRTRVSELIKDVVFIMGSTECFKQMFENLKSQSSSTSWDASEASLFVMCAVAKNILLDDMQIVPQVLQAVLALPDTTHIALRYTSILLVGQLSEWLEQHPQFLDPGVLQFLLAGLQQPCLASASATALQNICTQCRDHMINHFEGLLQIIRAIDSFDVSNEVTIHLLKGTVMILAQMPHDKIGEGLHELCTVQVTPLDKLLQSEDSEHMKIIVGSKDDPTVWIDRLAIIFRHTNPRITNGQVHPCQGVVEQIWPVLSRACSKYQADIRIIERCCRCIRFAVRCVGKGSATLLTPLVTQMVDHYERHQHSCYLYLGSILVDEYGTETGCIQGLLDMLQAFCVPTFKQLEEPQGLMNHPDTVDDFFRLCLRFVQRVPLAFLQCAAIKPVICCAIAACSLDHREASVSVTKFLTELIKTAGSAKDSADIVNRQTLAKCLLEEHGQALIQAILNACVFCLPSCLLADLADIIYEILLVDRTAVSRWLETALKGLPTENSGGRVTATDGQLKDFHTTITSANTMKSVSKAMREFQRLFR